MAVFIQTSSWESYIIITQYVFFTRVKEKDANYESNEKTLFTASRFLFRACSSVCARSPQWSLHWILTIPLRVSCTLSWFRPGWRVWTLQELCRDRTRAQMLVSLQTEPGEEWPKHSRSQTHSSLPSSSASWTDRINKQRRLGLVITHYTPQGKKTILYTIHTF